MTVNTARRTERASPAASHPRLCERRQAEGSKASKGSNSKLPLEEEPTKASDDDEPAFITFAREKGAKWVVNKGQQLEVRRAAKRR